jgi:tRNA 5-methylaminomethyl-2-thiouridine biosynthesis bifunctional protein
VTHYIWSKIVPAPRSSQFDDVYFSDQDGLAESTHVFLQGNKLGERFATAQDFVIAETGFGTGLNILNAWRLWDEMKGESAAQLTLYSFEKYPLAKSEIEAALSMWPALAPYRQTLLHAYPLRVGGWHEVRLARNVTLILIFDDINHAIDEFDQPVDAWFLDGFAPAKNPDMWSEKLFDVMQRTATRETTVATFTASGVVRDRLTANGFQVQKQKGYGRKRDMITAHYTGAGRIKQSRVTPQHVAVIGGGMAGAAVAHRLHSDNTNVTLFEKNHIAAGASGNMLGLFNPRFSQHRSAQAEFYMTAFAHAHKFFENCADDIDYRRVGSLHLLNDAEKEKRMRGAAQNWGWHDDHMTLTEQGLFLPDAGSISPAKLCRHFTHGFDVVQKDISDIDDIMRQNFDVIVLAGGAGMVGHSLLNQIPLHTVRGQIITAKTKDDVTLPQTNICYGGYCAPTSSHAAVLGSSFQPWLTDTAIRDDDTQMVLQNFYEAQQQFKNMLEPTGARASLRVAAKDRFPVIGGMFSHPHIYLSLAHGSHGILSSLLGARLLTQQITNAVQTLPRAVIKALSPARFSDKT